MRIRFYPSSGILPALVLTLAACGAPRTRAQAVPSPPDAGAPALPDLRDPREKSFSELRQLTFGGENAEAYWSFKGDQLIFQSTRPPFACDQIFRLAVDVPAAEPLPVSTGKGRTTCSYFLPGDERIIYSSTHLSSPACPPPPDRSQGYVWPLDDYEIFSARADGTDLVQLTQSPGYDAEATVCGRDGSIVFTSVRDGDLELYRMDRDGKGVRRLTSSPGYDGGAFFSADCSKLVWRASRPAAGKALEDYRSLLEKRLVRPTSLELWVSNADGSEARQVTYLGVASFGPSFFPSGERIIFSSNYPDPRGREFDLWAINVDGSGLERLTYTPGFDGFPLFSPDGQRLAFASNRNQKKQGDTDVYVARFASVPSAGEARAADRIRHDAGWLADDMRQGRGLGSAGLAQAADFLEQQYRAIGLEGVSGSYRHAFDVTVQVKASDKTALAVAGQPSPREAFTPLAFSSVGAAEGLTVVAGHGITAPELRFDDYKGINAKDRIVVVRRFAPHAAPFDTPDAERRFSDLRYKAFNAREHGARALIVVDAARARPGEPAPEEAPLPKLEVDPGGDAGIPVVVVTRALGEKLLAGPAKVRVEVDLVRERAPAHNIIGRLPAKGNKLDGAIVIGAHYDHIGLGGAGSLAPGVKEIHNGADDNASGTAALLEIARILRQKNLRRDVWFVAFSGEESGVLGSTAFVRSPPPGLAPRDVVAMLNLDMVGRLRDNRLSVLAAESSPDWPALVNPACSAHGVGCAVGGDGFGPSDHSPFYTAGVPVLHFFTGAHADYHRPSDDLARINAAGAAQIAAVVADVTQAVTEREARLGYKSAPVPSPARGDVRSAGASLGTIPDYTEPPGSAPGLRVSGVRPGGPAAQAGLVAGDRIVRIGKSDIRGIHDLEFVLRRARPGEKATLVYERAGKRTQVEVTFSAGQRR
jgi:hypothetical protein